MGESLLYLADVITYLALWYWKIEVFYVHVPNVFPRGHEDVRSDTDIDCEGLFRD